MQVRSTDLDRLLTLAGEIIIASSNQGLAYRSLQTLADNQRPVTRDILDNARDLSATMTEISGNLHHLVQSIRNITMNDMMLRARRLVRDVSRRTGKRVRFEVQGEQTTIDKSIIDKLWDPIAHQLRNAVDHGIEESLERARAGKSEEGIVHFRAYNTDRETIIEIRDDGRGIDLERLRTKAIDRGLITREQTFSEELALNVMCSPGFSTAATVSQTSGRGVGMDVVKNMIESVGGSVSFITTPGEGSTFTFRVPIVSAVNIVDTLVVRVGPYQFGIPIQNVVTTMVVEPDQINTAMGRGHTINHLDHLVNLHDLGQLMHGESLANREEKHISVIIIEHQRTRIALRVSECLSPQKLVIIPFNEIVQVEGLAGSTILGGRKLGFIIDPASLILLANRNGRPEAAETARTDRTHNRSPDSAKEPPPPPSAETVPPPPVAQTKISPAANADDDASSEEKEALIREYVAEIDRLTPQINQTLFEVEKDPANSESLNLAFRLFHTLKGNLIMMGYPAAGETVHSVESLLDSVRSRELEMSPPVMDLLMDGASFTEEVVRRLRGGDRQDLAGDTIIEQVRQMLPKRQRATDQPIGRVAELDYEISHEAAFREKNYRRSEVPLYQIMLQFDAGDQPAFLAAILIYNRVCQAGDVLAAVPRLIDMENGQINDEIKLLFASKHNPDTLETSLRKLLGEHYGVKQLTFSRHD